MAEYDFNCPKFKGFFETGDSSESDVEAYFDAVHPSPTEGKGSGVYFDASDKSRNAGRQSRPVTRSMAAALASPPLQAKGSLDSAKENKAPPKQSRGASQKRKEIGKGNIHSEQALRSVKAIVKAKARTSKKTPSEDLAHRGTKTAARAPFKVEQSLAELVKNFEKTPKRFRSRRSPQNNKRGKATTTFRPTIPVTPCLATRLRVRPIRIESKVERDQRLAEDLKKYKVRPSKVAPPQKRAQKEEPEAVPGPSGSGAPPPPLQAAVPIADHCKTREVPVAAEPGHSKFVAQPAPKAVLAGKRLRPLKRTARMTVAQSPAFALKERCQSWNLKRKRVEEAAKKEEGAAVAVPSKRPSRPRQRRSASQPQHKFMVSRQRSTTPQPFSFQARQEEALRKKQAKLEEEASKTTEVVQFKAKPAPPLKRVFQQRAQSVPVTTPKPFRLASLTRHEEQKKNIEQKVKQADEQLATLATKFVAKPCPTAQPFKPKLERKHTVPENVQLHLTMRARQRQDYDSALLGRIQKRTMESEKQKKAEEEAAVRKLRRKTVFRANPVPRSNPPAHKKKAAPKAARKTTPKSSVSALSASKRPSKKTPPAKK